MNNSFPFLSLDTLIAGSSLLGHTLEDRSVIREAQDWSLIKHWQKTTSVAFRNSDQQDLFSVAPLDLLVAGSSTGKTFHLLELNGTGIGGLTNMSLPAVAAVLDGMRGMAVRQSSRFSQPLVLIASSGKESVSNPRLNKLIYEKLLYAEAFKQGFQSTGCDVTISTMADLNTNAASLRTGKANVVVGYIKEFLDCLKLSDCGRLTLFGRPVTGLVNDRFCLNVFNQYDGMVDLSRVETMNRCHLAGADKGVAYGLLNDLLQKEDFPYFPNSVRHEVARSREELISIVHQWRRMGLCPVIKPQGTGLGHGIEFFLADESDCEVIKRIDRSIRLTQEFYQASSGAFPYTVCEYVDACTVPDANHPLFGHKYELRVVVYRDGNFLKAFPSIIKVAAEPVSTNGAEPAGLINNITASCMKTDAKGTDFMFPLANVRTLKMFQITEEEMLALCRTCTQYVRFVLDQVQDDPKRLGLPENSQSDNDTKSQFDQFQFRNPSGGRRFNTWPSNNLLHSIHH
jgi:hypothetical protein